MIPIVATEYPDQFITQVVSLSAEAAAPAQHNVVWVADRDFVLDGAWASWSTADGTAVKIFLKVVPPASAPTVTGKVCTADGVITNPGSATAVAAVTPQGTANTATTLPVLYGTSSGVDRNLIPAGSALVASFDAAPSAMRGANIGFRIRTRKQ
jgi:hypothetical protein